MVSEEMRGKEEEIKEKEEESLHHGGSFRKYMDGKIQKLQQQFKEQAADIRDQDRNSQKLFSGISIYVNGYTQPSHAELKVIMAKYGGMFHNYYSRRAVTHIVCSNLPDAKIKQFEQERDPTPVVRPEWIVDSIQAGKVLPIDGYILWRLRRGGPGQQMLPWVRPLQHGAENQYTMTETTVHDGRDTNKDGTNGDYSRTYSSEKLQKARQIAEKMRLECEMLKGPPKSSKEDPNFVQSFYRASRLHFIGTWKSRLENLISSEEFGIQNAPKPKSGGERCIVHIDMVRMAFAVWRFFPEAASTLAYCRKIRTVFQICCEFCEHDGFFAVCRTAFLLLWQKQHDQSSKACRLLCVIQTTQGRVRFHLQIMKQESMVSMLLCSWRRQSRYAPT